MDVFEKLEQVRKETAIKVRAVLSDQTFTFFVMSIPGEVEIELIDHAPNLGTIKGNTLNTMCYLHDEHKKPICYSIQDGEVSFKIDAAAKLFELVRRDENFETTFTKAVKEIRPKREESEGKEQPENPSIEVQEDSK